MNETTDLIGIIRAKKQNNFVMLDKGFINDSRLSCKEKGILASLLSRPDNWKVIVKNLMNTSTDGKCSIYSGLNKLKEYGYYKKEAVRNEEGTHIAYWESIVYETPNEMQEVENQIEDKQGNKIVRSEKENNFVMSDKSFLYDARLSHKAKGILVYILSKPDSWNVTVGDIMNSCTDSQFAIYSGLKELKKYGYYDRKPIRDKKTGRIIAYENIVYEISKDVPEEIMEQEENEASNIQKEPKQEDTQEQEADLQNNDFQNKEKEKKQKLNERKLERNKNINTNIDTTKNDINNQNHNHIQENQEKMIDDGKKCALYIEQIKENIEYDFFMQHGETYGERGDKQLYDELFGVICDVVCVKRENIRVNKIDCPYELVKSRFLKLTRSHLEYVIECMRKTIRNVKSNNIVPYMITSLYNALNTKNHYYNREVCCDMYTDFGII